MTGVDWIIVGFVTLLAFVGYGQGFVVGALSLGGFVAGAYLGSRLGPELLEQGARSPYAPLFALGGAILGGALLAVVLENAARAVRSRLIVPGLGLLDGVLGAVLSGVLALGLAWVFGAVALQTPGARGMREEIQDSEILSRLNDVLPPSTVLNALARFDALPELTGPDPGVAAPPRGIARDPDIRAAGRSVVRVTGTACGLGVEGSGWIARDGTVVTNAHVVAGQDDTEVQLRDSGAELAATAVAFDARNDVAVLRVDGLEAPALDMVATPAPGTSGAILGFPRNGPFDARAARIGATRSVTSQDAYGRGPVLRRMTLVRGRISPGNSGGPVVDGEGRVLTTVFAATVGEGRRGGYGVPNEVVASALRRAAGPVDTGPCTG